MSTRPPAPRPVPRLPVVATQSSDVVVPVPRTTLVRSNALLALFHLGLAIVTLSLGNPSLRVPTYKTMLTFVEYNATGSWELLPSFQVSGELAFTALTAVFFLLSSLFHALNATLLRHLYLSQLSQCLTPTRWIEYSFSAPVMILLIAYTLGVRDRATLYCIAVLVGITMPFGYWTEQLGRPQSLDAWKHPLKIRLLPWVIGHVPQVTAWFFIALQFYDGAFDSSRIPWFVYLILWVEVLLFFSFGFVSLAVQLATPRYFYRGELAFQALSLTSKGLLGSILLANVLMLSRFEDIY